MTEKAAKIRLAAASAGGVVTLTESQINRISNRPDEHQRRAMLKI
jgi:enoyl-[acyl-carrier-protein] reductase (NADH)